MKKDSGWQIGFCWPESFSSIIFKNIRWRKTLRVFACAFQFRSKTLQFWIYGFPDGIIIKVFVNYRCNCLFNIKL